MTKVFEEQPRLHWVCISLKLCMINLFKILISRRLPIFLLLVLLLLLLILLLFLLLALLPFSSSSSFSSSFSSYSSSSSLLSFLALLSMFWTFIVLLPLLYLFPDIWYVSHDKLGTVNIVSKCQVPSSNCLRVMIVGRLGGKGWLSDWIK